MEGREWSPVPRFRSQAVLEETGCCEKFSCLPTVEFSRYKLVHILVGSRRSGSGASWQATNRTPYWRGWNPLPAQPG